jgi:hypothetical protein
MTAKELVERLLEYPDTSVIYAFNGDLGQAMPVTGILYIPGHPGMQAFKAQPAQIHLQTDIDP